jgi:hypothetical protein
MKTRFLLLSALVLFYFAANAQNPPNQGNVSGQTNGESVITTAVPFLMIGPDGRAGGLGDGGVATSPDANSMHWNSAKYAFIESPTGFSISYTPWLKNLVNDINLAYVSFYHRLDDQQTVAATLRYFSLGEIQFTDDAGTPEGIYKPNEFAVDVAYARKLSDYLALSVDGRFIYSNLTAGFSGAGVESTAGVSVAADIGLYWQKDVNWFRSNNAQFAWGVFISNIGSKISYSKTNIEKDFIPTNLRFGSRLTIDMDRYNKISFNIDINKLLVPTPPIYARDSLGNPQTNPDGSYIIEKGKDPNVGPIRGIVQSFFDAPGGFREELDEFNFSIGAEYWYNDLLAIRAGYFYENKNKGDRQYITLGVGLRYNVFGLDFSYLVPTVSQQNPLEKTLRFSLLFNFGNNTGHSRRR